MTELRQKEPRVHDKHHLDFVRELPCVVCGNNIETQAAHIRLSDASVDKFNPGVGAKPDDKWTVPLCGSCHGKQYDMGDEEMFWKLVGINPLLVARLLYAVSGDHEEGCKIVERAALNILAAG